MKKVFYILLIAAALLLSCAIETHNNGTLVIRMPGGTNARSVSPAFLDTLTYRIDCEGHGSVSRTARVGEAVSIPLAAGDWNVTVTVFNAAEQEIGRSAAIPVTIEAGKTTRKELPITIDKSGCDITQFRIMSPVIAEGIINQTNRTINISVPAGTIVNNMQFSLVHTGKAVSLASGASRNFITPQTFTVTAEDNMEKAYTVTVTTATAITITSQPAPTTNVTAGNISGSLSVSATVTQGAILSYQWYSNTGVSNTGGTVINGATASSFAIPANLTAGRYYYFCEVRAAGFTSVRSNVAMVNVGNAIKDAPLALHYTFDTADGDTTAGNGIQNRAAGYTVLNRGSVTGSGGTLAITNGMPNFYTGTGNSYIDMGSAAGSLITGQDDYTISAYIRIELPDDIVMEDYYGWFLWCFSDTTAVSEESGRFSYFTAYISQSYSMNGWEGIENMFSGFNLSRNKWYHVMYREECDIGAIYVDGKIVVSHSFVNKNTGLGSLMYNWIGRSCFTEDNYMLQTRYADFRIYTGAVSEQQIAAMNIPARLEQLNNVPTVEMVWIPFGTFTMGSADDMDYNASPPHQVTISDNTGWYDDNSGYITHEVGKKPPNAWGLYDMHGNVWEWCWDWYGSYTTGAQTDPRGAVSGSDRVIRGGSWYGSGQFLRSAVRNYSGPSDRGNDLGFRLLRPSSPLTLT